MRFVETPLKGAYVIELEPVQDARGFFARAWCENELESRGLVGRVAQTNLSFNVTKGTLRGLHYQVTPHEEVKFIRCIAGSIFDVMVDLRPDSPTLRAWFGVELSAENRKMLYVPKGFAHGYQTMVDRAEVFYLTSEFYAPTYERGVRWNDPAFGISWPLAPVAMSARDQAFPDFA